MNVLLSIKPKYSKAILNKEKKYEFRKTLFKREDVTNIFIYSTSPVSKIVGAFKVEKILEGTPEEIWHICHNYAGISEEKFFNYFGNRSKAFAIKIKDLNHLDDPIDPKDIFEDFKPPRSFYYIKDDIVLDVERGI